MSAAHGQHEAALDATPSRHGTQPDAYDAATIRKLNGLTSDFYAREAASFSATRQAPWHGWEEAWRAIAAHDPAFGRRATDCAGAPLTVLDLGCGNLRFERFLAAHASAPVRVCAFDNCPELAALERDLPSTVAVEFRTLDLVESLLDGTFASRLPRAECDLAVAFGLMHHLPTAALRARLFEGLLSSLRPGGFAMVSFWQFLNDPRLAAKAAATTAEGRAAHSLPAFQENDFLLGWQHAEGVYRFCHHTPDTEIDALLSVVRESDSPAADNHAPAAPLPFREVARLSADGKHGDLNRYLIVQRL